MSDTQSDTALQTEVVIHIDFPVTVDGTEYTSFTMRRPKVKDGKWQEKLVGTDLGKGVALIARLCDVTPSVIDELYDSDAEKLNGALESFRGAAAQ